MAVVNRNASEKHSKKLSRAIKDSRYDSKYFENNEKLLKSINLKRDFNNYIFY